MLILLLGFICLVTLAALTVPLLAIETIQPQAAEPVPDRLDELVAWFRPGPDWAEIDAYLYQRDRMLAAA